MAILIESGIKEYPITLYEGQEPVVVRFNPTNMIFIEKVFNTFDEMDEIGEGINAKIREVGDDWKRLFELTREAEQKMRKKLNEAFGKDICTPLFGEYESVYAAGDGLPIWANILLAIIDEMDSAFVEEKKKQNPRIQKYTEKYSKRK